MALEIVTIGDLQRMISNVPKHYTVTIKEHTYSHKIPVEVSVNIRTHEVVLTITEPRMSKEPPPPVEGQDEVPF